MSSQIDALSRLFRDDDPETVGLVKEQLVLQGDRAVTDLRDLVNADSAIVAAHAQEVLHAISGKAASASLDSLILHSTDFPLEEACWLIASALMPWIDVENYRKLLDNWGGAIREQISFDAQDPLPSLIDFLHGKLGFNGNTDNYYNHENSLIPSVMENRKGLPLTLSLLYIFVGSRAGINIHGVNLPGHFIARSGETFFDPFHEGRILTIADCADILARQQIELTDEHLENPEPRQILARLLANLRHAYDVEEARWQRSMVEHWFALLIGGQK